MKCRTGSSRRSSAKTACVVGIDLVADDALIDLDGVHVPGIGGGLEHHCVIGCTKLHWDIPFAPPVSADAAGLP
jgi:hypothetical protein